MVPRIRRDELAGEPVGREEISNDLDENRGDVGHPCIIDICGGTLRFIDGTNVLRERGATTFEVELTRIAVPTPATDGAT